MPLRDRLRKTFSSRGSSLYSRSSGSDTSSLARQFTGTSELTIEGRRCSYIYQPGEKMPPLKYRRPVAKEHKDKLEAFCFADAWKRRSHVSVYSPHGSRMPSRQPSRNPSVVSLVDDDEDDDGKQSRTASSALAVPRRSFHRGVEAGLPGADSSADLSDATTVAGSDLSSSLESFSLATRE